MLITVQLLLILNVFINNLLITLRHNNMYVLLIIPQQFSAVQGMFSEAPVCGNLLVKYLHALLCRW